MRDNEDIRQLLANAGADQGPPLRLDPVEIADRGCRIRRRRHQIAVIGNVAAVTLIAALIMVSLLVTSRDRVPPAVPPVLTTHSPTPSVAPPPPVFVTPEVTAQPPRPNQPPTPGVSPSR